MHYVILAVHDADVCPQGNAATRKLLAETAPQMPEIAGRTGVKFVAGPYVNHEHTTVAVVEASSAEDLDRFIWESRLAQWNSVRILPSALMQEADVTQNPTIF